MEVFVGRRSLEGSFRGIKHKFYSMLYKGISINLFREKAN